MSWSGAERKRVEAGEGKNWRGAYTFTFHWTSLGFEFTYYSMNFNQNPWKKVTPLKYWRAQGIYFRCWWSYLHFQKQEFQLTGLLHWEPQIKHFTKDGPMFSFYFQKHRLYFFITDRNICYQGNFKTQKGDLRTEILHVWKTNIKVKVALRLWIIWGKNKT